MGINLASTRLNNGQKVLQVNFSEKDQHITVPVAPEEHIFLNFSLKGVSSRLEGGVLVLELPGGQCIYLHGAVAKGGGLIMLSSGKLVSAEDFLELQAQGKNRDAENDASIDGVDRLGALGTDQFQRNTEPPEESHQQHSAPNRSALSQGGGLGSGVGEFRSEAGKLMEGVWALPDQHTEYWGWASDNTQRQEGLAPSGEGRRPTTSVVVSGGSVSESATHITFSIDVATRETLGCSVHFIVGGGSAGQGGDYDLTGLQYYNGTIWVPLLAVNGAYAVALFGGSGSIQVRVPLVDDALSEGNETIGLTVTGINTMEGSALVDYTHDTQLSGFATIVEDTKINEGISGELDQKDGPVISVVRQSVLFVDESDTPGAAPSPAHLTNGDNIHTFRLDIKEHYDQNGAVGDFPGIPDPAGSPGDHVLLQDITITLKLGGDATLGDDYTFAASSDLQALIASGRVTLAPGSDPAVFTLTLHGRYDANGNEYPDADSRAFDVADFSKLTFEAVVAYDSQSELPERIELAIISVHGNEAHIDPGKAMATGMIADDANGHEGPILKLLSPVTTTEGAAADPADAPANKTDWHEIVLHVAAPSPIRTTITLAGANADSVLYDGTNGSAADFAWAGRVEYSLDGGAHWLTMPTGGYTYTEATGICALTIPLNATNVRFGVSTIDDLRETGDAANEGYTVTLGLETTGGKTDAEAVLHNSSDVKVGSLANTTTIEPETRPSGAGHLNPPAFDGPYVSVEAGTTAPVAESGGNVLPYTVMLKNPNGTGVLFEGTTENVVVTLAVSGSDGFQIQDLFAPTSTNGAFTGTISYSAYDAAGYLVGGPYTVTITGDGSTLSGDASSFSFNATIPPGAAQIKISIPVNDDPLGGASSSLSLLENLSETVTLEITDVKGNEARVNGAGSASVAIMDDTGTPSFEGLKVGLSWQGGDDTAKSINEGDNGVIMLRLFNNDGTNLTGSPYLNYIGNSKLPEDLSIKLAFADTQDSGDMALKFSTAFLALVDEGKATITIGNVTYTNAASLTGLEISGELTVTLRGGQFDLASDPARLLFNAHTFGDNIQEYYDHQTNGYGVALNEQFSLTVTEVSGNESSIKTSVDNAVGTISDKPDGALSLVGGGIELSSGANRGSWEFTLAVAYPDKEKTNHPATSAAAGSAPEGSEVLVPGEDTVITIRVTDGEVMMHGQEYAISAYSLFLSINGLTESDVSETDYLGNAYPATPGLIIVTQNGSWADNGSGRDTATFDLEVPKEYWQTLAGSTGTIDLTVFQGERVGAVTSGSNGGFVVSLESITDNAGEIVRVDTSKASASAKEDNTLNIHMTLEVTPNVFENQSANNAKDNIVTFSMEFAQVRGGTEVTTPFCMGREFSFEFTLRGNGTAQLNEDTGNNTLYPDLKDFALCDLDGNISSYSDITELTSKLQAILTEQYLSQDNGDPNVAIELLSSSGDIKFKITVSEGVNLSEGIDLHFVAMDNNTTDAGRTINGVISNITCEDPVISIKIMQDGGTATIQDGSRDCSGFAIALGDGYGYEKSVGDVMDGNGTMLDGKVHVPVYAYILSNGHMPGSSVADGNILSFTELLNIYNAKNPGSPLAKEGALGSDRAVFESFIKTNFAITQDITIAVALADGDNATLTEDYKNKTSETFTPASIWQLVVEEVNGEVFVYYKNECTVDSIDDTFTMPRGKDVDFIITVSGSSGNESRPVDVDANGRDKDMVLEGHGSTATGVILDYHSGPSIIELGPVDGKVYEPIDNKHELHAIGEPHVVADKVPGYTIKLNNATKEDMVVWLDITDNGTSGGAGAEYGVDYGFGLGMYQYKDGKYLRFEADGTTTEMSAADIAQLPPYTSSTGMDGMFFVIIGGGNSSVTFDVLVKDDNKDEPDDMVSVKVVDVQGGEATYSETIGSETFIVPWAKNVPYEYSVGGERVLVDPVNCCYYIISTSSKVTWDPASPPAWSLKPNAAGYVPEGLVTGVEKDLQIMDDDNGPVVSILHTSTTKVEWVETEDAPTVTITMQDYCQENVTVVLRLSIAGSGEQFLTLTIPEGSLSHTFTPQEINTAWQAAGGAALTLADRKSFDVQITDSTGGETDHNDGIIRVVIREGEGPAICLHDLQNVNITEGWREGVPGTAGAALELKMRIPGSDAGADNFTITDSLQFTITVNASPQLSGATASQYTVSLSKAQLEFLQASAETDYTVSIVMNGSNPEVRFSLAGNPVNFGAHGNPSVFLTGGSTLPAAVGDHEVGDSHSVGMSISGATSGTPVYIAESSLAYVNIADGTKTKLCLFVKNDDNTWSLVTDDTTFSENAGTLTMKAVLVLVDSAGNLCDEHGMPLPGPASDIKLADVQEVITEVALEFSVDYGNYSGNASNVDDNATVGADYIGSGKVRIDAYASSGEFTVTITNDDLTEGKQGLDLSLIATGETKDNALHILNHIDNGEFTGDIYGNTSVIIEDDMSGPVIRWNLSASTVEENGSLYLSWESFSRDALGNEGGSEIVSENVQLLFEITPRADFTLDEIASITIGDDTYDNGSTEFNALLRVNPENPSTWLLSPTFTGETGIGGVTISFKDDVISEVDATEGFTIKLKDVVGSEAWVGKKADGSDIDQAVDVTETRDGPIVDLVATSASEETSTVVYTLKLTGGKAIGEDAFVTIALNSESAAMVNGVVSIEGPKGTGAIPATITETFSGSGVYTITLPEGIGAGDYTILFPIRNSAKLEEVKFGVSLGSLAKGELGLVSAARFESRFGNESGGDTDNGGTRTFTIFTNNSAALNNCEGKFSFAVGGMTKEDVIDKVELTVNGSTVVLEKTGTNPPEAGKWFWDESAKQIVIITESGPINPSYDVTITFAQVGGAVTGDDLSDSKLNMAILNPQIVDREITISISNETTPGAGNGPEASIALDSDTFVEGGTITGTVKLALPSDLLEGPALLDDIVVVLHVKPAGADFTLSANPEWMQREGDVVTITIPKATPNPGNGFDLAFSMNVPNNSILDNPEYGVTITAVHGADKDAPVYEKYKVDSGNNSVTVTPEDTLSNASADKQGPVAGISLDAGTFVEGGDITGTLAVTLAHCTGESGNTLDDIILTLTVEPSGAEFLLVSPPAGCSFEQTGDTVTVTIAKGTAIPAGGFSLGFALPVPDNSNSNPAENPEYAVSLESITGKDGTTAVYEKYEVGSGRVAATPTNEAPEDWDGPVVSLSGISDSALEGAASLTGIVLLELQHGPSDGTNTRGELVIELALDIDPPTFVEEMVFSLVGNPAGCTFSQTPSGVVTITIEADTALPAGGLAFAVDIPTGSVGAQYSVSLVGIADSDGVYETCSTAGSAVEGEVVPPFMPFSASFAALALFAGESGEIESLLETGLWNLGDSSTVSGEPLLESELLAMPEAPADTPNPACSTWDNAGDNTAYNEQSMLIMKVMMESGLG